MYVALRKCELEVFSLLLSDEQVSVRGHGGWITGTVWGLPSRHVRSCGDTRGSVWVCCELWPHLPSNRWRVAQCGEQCGICSGKGSWPWISYMYIPVLFSQNSEIAGFKVIDFSVRFCEFFKSYLLEKKQNFTLKIDWYNQLLLLKPFFLFYAVIYFWFDT